jgi:3-hydroxyacyl-CoA dehydrogenase
MFYADQVGLLIVQRAMEGFARNDKTGGASWVPAPLLARLSSDGKTFN